MGRIRSNQAGPRPHPGAAGGPSARGASAGVVPCQGDEEPPRWFNAFVGAGNPSYPKGPGALKWGPGACTARMVL